MFGQVDGADRLVTGVTGSRDGWSQTGRAAHSGHTSLDGRARSTATMDDRLHDETTDMAARAAPGPITQGMQG